MAYKLAPSPDQPASRLPRGSGESVAEEESNVASEDADVRRAHRTELNPLSFLQRSVAVYPEKVAVVHEDRRYTYREFGDRVNRLASALQGAGLERGDRVAFVSPNTPALLEAHYGVPAAGGVLVALNYRLNPKDIGYILEHSGARFVFVDHEFEHLAEPSDSVERTVRIDDSGSPDDPYEVFLAEGAADRCRTGSTTRTTRSRSTTRLERPASPRAPSITTAARISTRSER